MKKLVIISFLCMVSLVLLSCGQRVSNEAIQKFLAQQKSRMVYIQGGKFMMGPGGETHPWVAPNNQPRHMVSLDSYYLDKYLVTWSDYDFYTKVEGKPNYHLPYDKKNDFFDRKPLFPVKTIGWKNAHAYCQWLAKISHLPYALPTEAQWEYAARNRGEDVLYSTNDGTYLTGVNTPSYDQLQFQKGADGLTFPLKVGAFPPNPLGIYDLTASISQWAKGSMYSYDYPPFINPQGFTDSKHRVVRGGGIATSSDFDATGTYFRMSLKVTNNSPAIGFRCALNLKTSPTTPQTLNIRHADFNNPAAQALYQKSLAAIKTDKWIKKYFGTVKSIGKPTGKLSWYPVVDGEMGNARGQFRLIGSKASATVYIAGINRNQSPWQLIWVLLDNDDADKISLFIRGQFAEQEGILFTYQALTGKWKHSMKTLRLSGADDWFIPAGQR